MAINPSLVLLRIFSCVSLSLYFLYFFYPYFYQYIYEEDVLYYLFNWPIKPLIDFPEKFYYVFLGMKFFATLMVFYRILYARVVFLVVTLLIIISNYQIGMMLLVHLEIPIISLIYMLDGIILYMLFDKALLKKT